MPALFRMTKTLPASYQIRWRGKYYQIQSTCANFMRRVPQHIQHLIIHRHSLGRKRRAGHIPIIQNRLPGQRFIPHRAQQVPPVNQTHMKPIAAQRHTAILVYERLRRARRLNRVAAGLSGVGAQPFLKRHAEGKALPDFLRRKRPVRFGAHLVRLDDRLPGNRSAAGGRFSLRPRPRDRSGIEKIRDALDKLRLAARNRKMVPAAERGQFFLQIIIAAKRLCVQRRAHLRSFAHGYNSSK